MKTSTQLLNISLALSAALFIAGCASMPPVSSDVRPGADFSRYKTFTLVPLPTKGPSSDPGLMLRIGPAVRVATIQALTAKGLIESDAASADLSFNVHGQIVPKVDVTQLGFSRPVTTRYGTVEVITDPHLQVDQYEQRTLTIEAFDNRTKENVWLGWATRDASGPVKLDRVTNAIARIIDTFPVGSSSANAPAK